jgi:hypothetical protein
MNILKMTELYSLKGDLKGYVNSILDTHTHAYTDWTKGRWGSGPGSASRYLVETNGYAL